MDEKTNEALRLFTREIEKFFPVVAVVLFGSRARGDFDVDSDADVAVVLDIHEQPNLRLGLELNDLAYNVLEQTGIHITPLPIALPDWDKPDGYTNPGLLSNIAREGVPFYPANMAR